MAKKRIGYKVVELRDGRYFSLYDNTTEYVIGKRMAQRVKPDHESGYYAFRDYPDIATLFGRVAHLFMPPRLRVAILRVQLSGAFIEYGDKLAVSVLTPLDERSTWNVWTKNGEWRAERQLDNMLTVSTSVSTSDFFWLDTTTWT